MSGKQTIVGAGGIGLIAAHYWLNPNRGKITSGLFGNGTDTAEAHHELKMLGGELLFVVVATILAGISDSWATAMVAIIVALFILFAMNYTSRKSGA